MKKLILALLLFAPVSAWAVCPTPLTVKDAAGTTQNISTTDDGSGNCQSNMAQGTQAASATGSTWFVQDASVVNAINANAITGYATSGCAGATIANTKTKPFSNAAASTTLELVAGVTSQNVHICAVNIGPVAGTVNVALVEGGGATCGTSTAGLMGGATAATGWQLIANFGLTFGNGQGLIGVTATTADNVCVLFSAGVQVSGVITYAIF